MDMICENNILKEMLGVERRGRGQVEIWLMSKIGLELLQDIHHLNYWLVASCLALRTQMEAAGLSAAPIILFQLMQLETGL